jgi:CubicO group peptidase (beta-lactamase class C family)
MQLLIKIFFTTATFCASFFLFSLEAANHETAAADRLKDFHILTNETCDTLKQFDTFERVIEKFMKEKKITGLSLAISKDERLVYARGFGYTNDKKTDKIQPYHLLRVASVSKLITAVAVMKLVNQNKLSLEKTVFGANGILPEYKLGKDKRLLKIKVKHLLEHSSGWDAEGGDPMFQSVEIARQMKMPAPASIETIITYALRKKLTHAPGEHYHYSNLGYAILGKIIEKISGRSYEGYVQNEILHPLGIHFTKLGHSLPGNRDILEVGYNEIGNPKVRSIFDAKTLVNPADGGFDMETLASAGGWIATPVDILRLVNAIDAMPNRRDILPSDITLKMPVIEYTPFGKKWAYGWAAGYGEKWWRTGSLRGTSARVVRGENGVSWAVITNTNDWQVSHLAKELDAVMQKALATVSYYPAHDLF